jgi:hypothetical protein
MPYIVANQQGADAGCQRANNIPVNAAKIDGIVQFLADFFKSLPFPPQIVFGLIPFGSRGLKIFLNAFGKVIGIHQPIADEQRIAFHGFRVLENDVLQFAVLGAALDLWQEKRLEIARSVVKLTDRMTKLATASSSGLKLLSNAVLSIVGQIPFAQHAIAEKLAELDNK